MERKVIEQLQEIVGRDHVFTSDEARQCYSYDGSAREFLPDAVVLPGNAQEVCRIMELASREQLPVVPRGAGSGMTGGALAVQGGLVLGMARFNRILEIDVANQLAVVEPGVITGVLQDEVRKQGLFYPPDPASLRFCTIGGNVGECAGGPSAVKYGVTRDYIKGLEVVLADGRIIHTGVRTDKGVVGYDLTRLFVGSEGTLGVVTKIIVRLLPQPQARKTLLVMSGSIQKTAALVSDILAVFVPCMLEFMDKTALSIIREVFPCELPQETEALLLIELDGTAAAVEAEGERLLHFLQGRPEVAVVRQAASVQEANELWAARRAVSPLAFQLKPHKISEDVVVPRNSIPDLVVHAEQLARELDLIIFTFGHAGDGNIHVNIMVDKENQEEARRGEEAKERLFKKVLALSGTISGEHGIGITKSAAMLLEVDAATIAAMKAVKQAFDPQNILNPGKIFP